MFALCNQVRTTLNERKPSNICRVASSGRTLIELVKPYGSIGRTPVCLGSPVRYILTAEGNEKVLSKLGFSDGYELSLCVAMGYPEGERPEAKPRDMSKVKFVD